MNFADILRLIDTDSSKFIQELISNNNFDKFSDHDKNLHEVADNSYFNCFIYNITVFLHLIPYNNRYESSKFYDYLIKIAKEDTIFKTNKENLIEINQIIRNMIQYKK